MAVRSHRAPHLHLTDFVFYMSKQFDLSCVESVCHNTRYHRKNYPSLLVSYQMCTHNKNTKTSNQMYTQQQQHTCNQTSNTPDITHDDGVEESAACILLCRVITTVNIMSCVGQTTHGCNQGHDHSDDDDDEDEDDNTVSQSVR